MEAADRGEPLPPGLHEQLNALTEEQLAGVALEDEDDDNNYLGGGGGSGEGGDEEDSGMDALADSVAGLSSSVRCACRFQTPPPVIDGTRFRSAYEDKVREQQRVLYSLQEEKSRLASIKNELSRLKRASGEADAEQASNGKREGGVGGGDGWMMVCNCTVLCRRVGRRGGRGERRRMEQPTTPRGAQSEVRCDLATDFVGLSSLRLNSASF